MRFFILFLSALLLFSAAAETIPDELKIVANDHWTYSNFKYFIQRGFIPEKSESYKEGDLLTRRDAAIVAAEILVSLEEKEEEIKISREDLEYAERLIIEYSKELQSLFGDEIDFFVAKITSLEKRMNKAARRSFDKETTLYSNLPEKRSRTSYYSDIDLYTSTQFNTANHANAFDKFNLIKTKDIMNELRMRYALQETTESNPTPLSANLYLDLKYNNSDSMLDIVDLNLKKRFGDVSVGNYLIPSTSLLTCDYSILRGIDAKYQFPQLKFRILAGQLNHPYNPWRDHDPIYGFQLEKEFYKRIMSRFNYITSNNIKRDGVLFFEKNHVMSFDFDSVISNNITMKNEVAYSQTNVFNPELEQNQFMEGWGFTNSFIYATRALYLSARFDDLANQFFSTANYEMSDVNKIYDRTRIYLDANYQVSPLLRLVGNYRIKSYDESNFKVDYDEEGFSGGAFFRLPATPISLFGAYSRDTRSGTENTVSYDSESDYYVARAEWRRGEKSRRAKFYSELVKDNLISLSDKKNDYSVSASQRFKRTLVTVNGGLEDWYKNFKNDSFDLQKRYGKILLDYDCNLNNRLSYGFGYESAVGWKEYTLQRITLGYDYNFRKDIKICGSVEDIRRTDKVYEADTYNMQSIKIELFRHF